MPTCFGHTVAQNYFKKCCKICVKYCMSHLSLPRATETHFILLLVYFLTRPMCSVSEPGILLSSLLVLSFD